MRLIHWLNVCLAGAFITALGILGLMLLALIIQAQIRVFKMSRGTIVVHLLGYLALALVGLNGRYLSAQRPLPTLDVIGILVLFVFGMFSVFGPLTMAHEAIESDINTRLRQASEEEE